MFFANFPSFFGKGTTNYGKVPFQWRRQHVHLKKIQKATSNYGKNAIFTALYKALLVIVFQLLPKAFANHTQMHFFNHYNYITKVFENCLKWIFKIQK
jgi:hypothetical protein